ncbi:hypothetical protein C8R43DRAFT_946934 [Mycena crocata]|nr:hypothetical protein C8R43DRAFT_946934 [Mycena crocata]
MMLLVRGYKPESAVPVVIIWYVMSTDSERGSSTTATVVQGAKGEFKSIMAAGSLYEPKKSPVVAWPRAEKKSSKSQAKAKAVDDGRTLKKQKTKSGKEEEDDEQEEKVLETEDYMNVESTVLISWDPQPGAGNIPLSFWEKASNQWDETLGALTLENAEQLNVRWVQTATRFVESCLAEARTLHNSGKGLVSKFITGVLHSYEFKRTIAVLSMIFHQCKMYGQILHNTITFSTKPVPKIQSLCPPVFLLVKAQSSDTSSAPTHSDQQTNNALRERTWEC